MNFTLLRAAILAALATGLVIDAGSTRHAPRPARSVADFDAATALLRSGDRVASAAAKTPPKPPPLVKLEIEAPRFKKDLPYGMMFSSGWPLVIRAVGSPAALGVATNALPSLFPGILQTGYLVFQDPDNCLELPPPYVRGPAPCSTGPSDETYLEFSNDVDMVGVVDEVDTGNPGRAAALANPLLSGDAVFHGDGDLNNDQVLEPVDVAVGPETGEAVADGVGFGADDDFPGLVLLSPTGVGRVLNADFSRPAVRQQRNLAGFLNTVAYELNDPDGSTTITASMVMPHGLIAPLMKIDDCVGTVLSDHCDGGSRYSIDGGAIVTAPANTTVQSLYPQVFNSLPYYEVRAFVVSGVAPSVLSDGNGDGIVTASDATLAGYNVISNEEIVRVRQYHGEICGGVPLLDVFYADLDGNGRAIAYLVCPAGPGQITRPPR